MIRRANEDDSARIAEIDVNGSRYAYKNILPDICLYNDLSVEKRFPVHRGWITEQRFDVYVYEDAAGTIMGMMGMGPCEDDDKKDAFELHYIYVDPGHLRMGIGSDMLDLFEQKGIEHGCSEYVVWVLEENVIGRSFYEKNSYHSDGRSKIFRRWGKQEIRYVKAVDS